MKCPQCNAESTVVDSRPKGQSVRRRRRCLSCGHRWSTAEAEWSSTMLTPEQQCIQLRHLVAELEKMVPPEGSIIMALPHDLSVELFREATRRNTTPPKLAAEIVGTVVGEALFEAVLDL